MNTPQSSKFNWLAVSALAIASALASVAPAQADDYDGAVAASTSSTSSEEAVDHITFSSDSLSVTEEIDAQTGSIIVTVSCLPPRVWKVCPNGGGAAGSKPGRPVKRCLKKAQPCPLPQ